VSFPVWRAVVAAWRGVWERLSLYLPIALMGVLALGTYWLVRSTPEFAATPPPQTPRHEPDYTMKNFSVKAFDAAGRLKSEVLGAETRHYPDTDTVEIAAVRIYSHNARGQLTTATANRAITNADGSEVQLLGNATVMREAGSDVRANPPLSFAGDHLHANLDTELVRADQPVRLTRGRDVFTADTLALDNAAQWVELRGRVRGSIAPAPDSAATTSAGQATVVAPRHRSVE
jgi:lipopolysaccharide export system protein LptC